MMRRLGLFALLAADGVSRAGNTVTAIAVPLYVLATTGSPLATGVVGVFATLPIVLGGAFGGALVDRIGRRTSSVISDLASGVTVLAIPVLAGLDALPFWALVSLVFLSGILDTPGGTARTTMLPALAERAGTTITRVTGAHATVQRTASLLGAGLAGGVVALVGPANALYLNAACFALSALLVLVAVPRSPVAPDAAGAAADTSRDEGYWRALGSGLVYLVRHPLVRSIVVLVVVTNAIDAAGLTVLKPVYATGVDDGGAFLGLMLACFAGGALVGAATYSAIGHRLPQRGLLAVTFFLAGVPPYLAMALDAPAPLVLVVLVFSGLAAGPINPILDTALFAIVPDALRARVFGAISAGVAAAMPLGALLAGAGVELWGLTVCLVIATALYAIATLSVGVTPHWRTLDVVHSAGSAPDDAEAAEPQPSRAS